MIIIYTDGGLGSRLSCLANGLFFVDNLRSQSRIFWPLNESCAANFSELFKSDLIVENFNKVDLKSLKNCSILSSDNFLNLPVEHFLDPWAVWSGRRIIDWCLQQLKAQRVLIIFGHRIIPQFYGKITAVLSKRFSIPQPTVKYGVGETEVFLEGPAFFGVHLRGTDGKRSGPYLPISIFFLKFLSVKIGAKVFLATDDMLFIRYTKLFMPRIKIPRRTLPRKKYKDLGWASLIIDSNYEMQPYNIIRDRESVIDATIDIIMLGRCRVLIINSTSTFLEVAGILSGVRFRCGVFMLISRLRHLLGYFRAGRLGSL